MRVTYVIKEIVKVFVLQAYGRTFFTRSFCGVELVVSTRNNVEVVGSNTVGPLIEQMS
jgi:hypothetical protein